MHWGKPKGLPFDKLNRISPNISAESLGILF